MYQEDGKLKSLDSIKDYLEAVLTVETETSYRKLKEAVSEKIRR